MNKIFYLKKVKNSKIQPVEQNFPNPFASETKISFRIVDASHVVLNVYNTSGQKVKTLANADYKPDTTVSIGTVRMKIIKRCQVVYTYVNCRVEIMFR